MRFLKPFIVSCLLLSSAGCSTPSGPLITSSGAVDMLSRDLSSIVNGTFPTGNVRFDPKMWGAEWCNQERTVERRLVTHVVNPKSGKPGAVSLPALEAAVEKAGYEKYDENLDWVKVRNSKWRNGKDGFQLDISADKVLEVIEIKATTGCHPIIVAPSDS